MYSLTIRKLQLSWYRPKKIQLHRIPKRSRNIFCDENGNWDVESRVCNSSFLVADVNVM